MSEHPVADLLARLPEGWSEVRYRGRRWGVSRTRHVGGRVEKLYAEELGGVQIVSANLYLPGAPDRDGGNDGNDADDRDDRDGGDDAVDRDGGDGGEQLRPCEMPAADILDFLRGWEPPDETG